MQRSLGPIAATALAAAAIFSSGCQNQVAQTEADAKRAATVVFDPQSEQNTILRPVRFSMKVHSGSSGALLPTNIDTQLSPLLEKFDEWDQITRIVIVGHTDGEGSESSNLLLSLRRANALAGKLMDYGVSEEALDVDGRGEAAPIASNSSISGKQLNRRVEIIAYGEIEESLEAIDYTPRLGQRD